MSKIGNVTTEFQKVAIIIFMLFFVNVCELNERKLSSTICRGLLSVVKKSDEENVGFVSRYLS